MKTKLLFILTVFFSQITAFAQTVSLPSTSFTVGETIPITWASGTGGGSDWLGVYNMGETPGSATPSRLWDYVATAGGSVDMDLLANGEVVWALPAGDYYVALLLNDSYTVADSFNFTIATGATVSADQTDYAVSEDITITYADGTGLADDWVGIWDQSVVDPDGNYLEFAYVTTGQESAGSLVISPTALPQGDYYAVLLHNNSYVALSEKVNFTVAGGLLSTNEFNLDKIGVYPNPVNGSATINMQQAFNKVELYDSLGRKVVEASNLNTNEYTLNATDLKSGLYIVRVHADTVYNTRIIIK